jgi:hypothetical protein
MTQQVLSRRELDPARCGVPGCACPGPLRLHAACHPGRPIDVSYDWTTGLLTARCSRCSRLICRIAVADSFPAVVVREEVQTTDVAAAGSPSTKGVRDDPAR